MPLFSPTHVVGFLVRWLKYIKHGFHNISCIQNGSEPSYDHSNIILLPKNDFYIINYIIVNDVNISHILDRVIVLRKNCKHLILNYLREIFVLTF